MVLTLKVGHELTCFTSICKHIRSFCAKKSSFIERIRFFTSTFIHNYYISLILWLCHVAFNVFIEIALICLYLTQLTPNRFFYTMLYSIIVALITLIAILITITVLLQSGQGSGLSGGIAGNAGGAAGAVGSRRTADFLSKSTSVLGGTFLVLCLVANFFIDRNATTRSAVQQSSVQFPVNNQLTQPAESPAAIPQTEQPAQEN
jgi:preprotein translocase subunit SecG